jgi:polyhydroxybutyrate depolymerase
MRRIFPAAHRRACASGWSGLLVTAMLCGCGCHGTRDRSPPPEEGLVASRPYRIHVPATYVPGDPAPLIVLLHYYGSSGAEQSAYFGFAELARDRGVLVAYPDGSVDRAGQRFWNATDACCDVYGMGVDDVAYLTAVLDDIERRYDVDRRRVYLVGHSSGAFMAHRMACDLAPRVAGIVALAGDVWNDPARCGPGAPVAVLQVHGDGDGSIPYAGGDLALGDLGPFPSAPASVGTWAALNGCATGLEDTGERVDVEASLPGAETRIERARCAAGAAELWTIEGGRHIPTLQRPGWGNAVFDWLEAHRR